MQMRDALVYVRYGRHQCEAMRLKDWMEGLDEVAPCLSRNDFGIGVDDERAGVFRRLAARQVGGAVPLLELVEGEVMEELSMLDVLEALD